ncbi:MAG: asparagine synthase (glutamine-hydrolyzing) [Gemmatimonadota bacterium]|nr:asparagine synthase (glutamine-hydrolyzing) [Gemmatimonadota bacterium]
MCGIVGKAGANRDGRADILAIQCGTLRHRGPDASGEWRSPDHHVALGHRRLSIIDLSEAGSQPMADVGGALKIVLNGEIYNYRELKQKLESLGHRFRSASDTEVLLEAYREWGTDCLQRMNGMFAFAIYDAPARRVFLARDRAGEKPLFYHHADGRLSFASELKALMVDRGLSRTIDPLALDHFLAYGYVPGELCLLSGVKKLPPAHALVYDIDSNDLRVWRYWSLPAPVVGGSEDAEQLIEELDTLLADSVRHQLVADVPVGVLLSGGVDSSLITAMAARVSSSPVRTFTISFPGHGSYDEAPYARLVGEHFGTRHTELVAEPATVELLPELARQYDEPVGDSSMVPTYLVSRLVRESCTVALGGDAGDELFGGYMHYSRVQEQQHWRSLMPRPMKTAIGNTARLLPTGFRGRTYLRSLALPDAQAWVGSTLHFDAPTRRRLAPATRGLQGAPPEAYRLAAGSIGRTTLQKMTAADFFTYLPEDILVKVDRASMLASLEVRAPFLDYRIIELAFGKVPDRLRATRTERKILLKMLAARILPPALDLQRKQGFSLPLDTWFKGEWGVYLAEVLKSAPPALYDRVVLKNLLAGQARGFANAQRLFNLAILELWRREYDVQVDGHS